MIMASLLRCEYDASIRQFTGKERDAETGLDWFTKRYLSSAQGRFTSPDPLGGHLEDPQTFNRYAYARNNPLRFTDSTGLDFYLDCKGENAGCQNGHVGITTSDENGKLNFTPTVVNNDKPGGPGLVDQYGAEYSGNFDEHVSISVRRVLTQPTVANLPARPLRRWPA